MRRLQVSAMIVSAMIAASGGALVSPALAADAPLPPLAPPPAYVVSEFISGWYFRGDFSYRFFGSPGGSLSNVDFINSSYDNALGFGAGVGLKSKWFRADVTVDAANPRFLGSTAFAAPAVNTKVLDVTTLLNAYFDLGTWARVTPYVGAGIGFSYLKVTGFTSASGIAVNSEPIRYDLAWAAMAGLSYAVTRNFLIDTGYRYLHAGSARTDLGAAGAIDYGNMNAHEVRIGMRFLID
jgi:opacity protein-like surface antigen